MKKALYLLVLCLILSCENDDQVVNTIQNNNDSSIKLEYVSKEAYQDKPEVNKVIKRFSLNKAQYLKSSIGQDRYDNILAKTTYLPEYEVTIKEDNVAHIQAGEYESFTYQIVNTYIDDELHNLFLSKRSDGSYKAFIAKYALTESQKTQIENGVKPTDLNNSFILIPISDSGDFPETASSPSDCNNEPPCLSYPCCVTIDGMSWVMTSSNTCIAYNSFNSIFNQTGPEGPCPPEFTAVDGDGGGGSGDGSSTNPNESDTSSDNGDTSSDSGDTSSGNDNGTSTGNDSSNGPGSPPSGGGGTSGGTNPCGSDPNCSDDNGPGSTFGGTTNPEDDSSSNQDDEDDECIPVGNDVNGFMVCNVTTPVVCVDNECVEEEVNEECDKINDLLSEYPDYKTKLLNLITNIENSTFEKGEAIDVDGNEINIPDGEAGSLGEIPTNPNKKYLSIAHIHDAQGNEGNGTYSVPSLGDLANLGYLTVIENKVKTKDFVYFLFTADGTYYALTIDSQFKFKNFWEYLIISHAPDFYTSKPENERKIIYNKLIERTKPNNSGFYHKYFNNPNGALIDETSNNNDQQLKYFLQFLNEENAMGITVFETDSQLSNFTRVKLNKDNPNGEPIKDDCN